MKEILFKFIYKLLQFKEIIVSVLLLFVVTCTSSYILGYAYSSHVVNNIPTIVVDHDNSDLSKNLVTQINTNEVFNVINYSNKNEDVETLINKGTAVIGVIIPDDFSRDLIEGRAPKILIFYDGSQMSAVSSGKTRIAEILGTIKASYLMNLGEGKLGLMPEEVKNNVIPIQCKSIFVGNSAKSTANFIIQGMLIGIAQIGIIILGVLIVSKKENYLILLIKSIIYGLVGSSSIILMLFIQFKYFQMPYRGSIKAGIILTIIFSIIIINLGIIFRLIMKDKLAAVTNSGLLISSTVLLAGYTFPLMAMPDTFKNIAKYIPFLYYGIPMRDLSLVRLSFNDIKPKIYDLIQFMIYTWIIILFLLTIKKLLKLWHENNFKNKILNKLMKRRNKDEVA